MRPGSGEVRIIGGQWKRSKLPVANAPGLRPSPDRVRETLFNWLGQDLTGWRCLDAFAGSGALGFEAASRGAADVLMVEREPRIGRTLQQTKERLGASTVRIVVGDAITLMKRSAESAFDLVLIDPPFDSPLAAPALVEAARLVGSDGVVYLEGPLPLDAEWIAGNGWSVHRQSRAGSVHFHLLRRSPA